MHPTRSLHPIRLAAITVVAAAWISGCGGSDPVGPENYTLIARDFVDGLYFIDGSVPPALTSDGKVAFVGTRPLPDNPNSQTQAIYFGDGSSLTSLGTQAAGYTRVLSVQYATSGDVAFVSERTPDTVLLRGAYRTNTLGTAYTTLREAKANWSTSDGDLTPPQRSLAMSPNGTIAFSAIINGFGEVLRVAPGGAPEVMRSGEITAYNTGNQAGHLDVNDAGEVAVQFEYLDPVVMLMRGLFVLDAPGETLATSETTLMRQPVSFRAPMAINASGQVAFSLAQPTIAVNYYTPPTSATGAPTAMQAVLQPGVYLATPAPFGTPFTFTQIASTASGYSAFGRVDLNDSGTVVFEADHDGSRGIFRGGDPVLDRIAITRQPMIIDGRNHFFSFVRLGQLNNANQVSIQTSDYYTTDQIVWRIDNVR